MCSAWESLMKSLIDHHFPLKKKRIRKQTHPWLDSTVLKVMRTRDQVHKRAKTSLLSSDWNEYKLLRNKVTALNREVRKNYFRNKLEENRDKPKVFWDTLRQVLPSKNYITEIDQIVVDCKELIDKHDIANFLNDYFTTIASSLLASQQSHGSPVDLQQDGLTSISNHRFKCHAVSENDVFKVLRTTYISKATGEDSIPAKVIRTAASYISNGVANLFNASFQHGRFPPIWKTARVAPLFRPNVIITDQSQYFPVSQKCRNRLLTIISSDLHMKMCRRLGRKSCLYLLGPKKSF